MIRVRKDIADGWSDAEVIDRWFRLYSPDVLFVNKFRRGEALLPGGDMALADWVKQKRKLLFSLSRFK
ncbi:MAG: alpha-amylase family glycosyl hydrolase, partial [bacterium]